LDYMHELETRTGRGRTRLVNQIVNEYIAARKTPKPRGRGASVEAARVRVEKLEKEIASLLVSNDRNKYVRRVMLLQRLHDARTRLEALELSRDDDLEEAFVAVAREFAERNNVTAESLRDSGVPVSVLRRAGMLSRQRRSSKF
jgi:hypothetical protein